MIMKKLLSMFKTKKGPRADKQRGVALIIVMGLVVMFTSVVADFVYNSRIRYVMSSHTRDGVAAESLAVSGLRLYQLLLLLGSASQAQLSASPFASQLKSVLENSSIVVRYIPCLDTAMFKMISANGGVDAAIANATNEGASNNPTAGGKIVSVDPELSNQSSTFGFSGDFLTCAKEESSKISLNGIAKGGMESAATQLLLQTLKRDTYIPLFRENNLSPEELISNIIDWADANGERANLQGYEDNLYNNLADPYLTKNAYFDSISELHLVAGMTDSLFEVISPLVSAYTDNDKVSLPLSMDESGKTMLAGLLIASNPTRSYTNEDIDKVWEHYRMSATLSPPDSAQELATLLSTSPYAGTITADSLSKFISTGKSGSKVFSITSTGRVNDVERTLETVIHIGKDSINGGTILYWRED